MKRLYTLLFLCCSAYLHAQGPLHTLTLNGSEPKWIYQSVDTTFVKISDKPHISEYTSQKPNQMLQVGESLYLVERSITQNISPNGFLLHKLNVDSGEVEWIHHNTTYTVLGRQEDYSGSKLDVFPDGNLCLIGIQDTARYVPQFKPNIYGSLVKRVINHQTGLLETMQLGDTSQVDRNAYVYWTGSGAVRMSSEEKNVIALPSSKSSSNATQLLIDIYDVDDQLSIDTSIRSRISYDIDMEGGTNIFTYPPKVIPLNRDTLLGLFVEHDKTDMDASPRSAHMIWIDLSNPDEASTVYKDVTEYTAFPQEYGVFPKISTKDNHAFYHQTILYQDQPVYSYLVWFEPNGDVIRYIPSVEIDGLKYRGIRILGVHNGDLYIAGKYKKEGQFGYDFIRVKSDSSALERLGSMTVDTDKGNITIGTAEIAENGDVVVGFIYSVEEDKRNYVYSYYVSYAGRYLGIGPSSVDEVVQDYTLSPNPTSGRFNIKELSPGTSYSITGVDGRMHMKGISRDGGFDISSLVPGVYFLYIDDDKGARSLKVVKTE